MNRWSWYWGGLVAGVRAVTPRRVQQIFRVGGSYLLARGRIGWFPPRYPLFLGVEPTTACNLRCPHCISGLRAFTRPTGRLDPVLFEELVEALHPYIWGVLFYFQGEPLLHPEIGRLIGSASRYKLLTSLSTNGHFLTEDRCYDLIMAGLTHIRISIDGMTAETYARYRREGELETVQAGTARLLEIRQALRSRFPLVEVQFIAFRHNVKEIPAFRRWADEMGVDAARIKTAQLLELTPDAYEEWIPKERRQSRYEMSAGEAPRLRGKVPNRCWRMWRAAEVTWDGQVLPCCFDKDAQHTFGSLKKTSFAAIWKGEKVERFRRQVFQRRESIDICRNCTEGIRTWL
ncbi:MAG: SPASM domain-containing protein [Bacteroidia bacterium]|nr:SPASM domain-containing protein [Bacteroidia bacterium]